MTRVLIVEDEEVLRDIYVLLFKMNQFDVYQAANGKIALQEMDRVKPNVIILDVLMPVMGGIEFLKLANLKKNYPNTKVLLLTNLSDPKTIAISQKLDAQKYLLKASVSPAELVQSVKDMLKTS